MKTCVVTLDLINDICDPSGKLARFADRIEANQVISNTNKVLAWAREQGHMVAHVKVGFRPDYKDASTISPIFSQAEKYQALNLATSSTDFVKQLNIETSDLTIVKHRVSAFYGTELEVILRANRIEKLILVGVATNNAVELTAREAHDRDFYVTVVSDATETVSDEEQRASLNFLNRISTVCSTSELTSK